MKQFLTVLKFELNNYFKNKSFVITTFLLALVIAAVVIVPTLIPGLLDDESETAEPDTSEELVIDEETDAEASDEEESSYGICVVTDAEDVNLDMICAAFPAEWKTYESEKEIKEAVETGDIEAGFVMESPTDVTYVVNDLSMYDYLGEMFSETLAECYKQQYLLEKGLTAEEILESESFYVNVTEEVLGKDSGQNYWYTYVLVFVVYFLIIFYGQMIATSVTTEKSNRAIEILVTSVNSNSLICGKVLAGAIAGVLQAGIILGSGFASYGLVKEAWGGLLDFLFDIPANVLIVYAVFAVLSYLLYAFIFGMLGALVSKTEDISKSSSPVLMIYIASFMIAIFGMTSDSNSMLMKVASYIPFTSGNAMFIRVSMGSVEIWEVLLSAVILVASCVLAGVLAAKIFRFGTLHYGNPIKLRTALKKANRE
ncbi:MAG: ABC transporter permease [Tyzzerella sp.]|nr:ABC transporter permease [Tyzzerella sp.]